MRVLGECTYFNIERGFGFLRTVNERHPDVFLHISALEKAGLQAPARGARYEFDIVEANDGRLRAADVVLSSPPE